MSTQLLFGQISKLSAINGINDAFLIATILAGLLGCYRSSYHQAINQIEKQGINFLLFYH